MVAGGGARARTMLTEASVGGVCGQMQLLVVGETRRAHTMMWCGRAIGQRCCVAKWCCWVMSSECVAVVVVGEECRCGRWSRHVWRETIAELLKSPVSGRGGAPSCNYVVLPGRGIAGRRGEC